MDLSFGDFRLDAARKMLWRGQTYVPLGARAYAILTALLENPGRLVSKSELFERAWPGVSVDAANLRIQIAQLRRVLGDLGQNIVTEQSIGYSYTGEVRQVSEAGRAPIATRFHAPATLLKPLGRQHAISSVIEALKSHRLVSIVGPGGIGKTTLALDIAERLEGEFQDGVCFVDLSLAVDEKAVANAVAAALERPVTNNPMEDVGTYLRTRRVMLVLDCCERAIKPIAEFTHAILTKAPGVVVIATSREVMRVSGEFVEQLEGLALPPQGPVTAEQALEYAAIALFNRSATATNAHFKLNDDTAQSVAAVCRGLDGIPLAIDLAAGLTGTLGLQQIADGLAQRMSLLAFGRRGGESRHRTLDAAIAWSYDTLTSSEATTLRRLSIFADAFTMEAALEVVVFGVLDRSSAELAIVSLAQKSLLNVSFRIQAPEYRLLDTTRVFAASRLGIEDEMRDASASHAQYVLKRMPEYGSQLFVTDQGTTVSFAKDIRAALDWAYREDVKTLLPIYLTIGAEPIWLKLRFYSELYSRMTQARTWLEEIGGDGSTYDHCMAAVMTGIANSTIYDAGAPEKINDVEHALQLAKAVDDFELIARNLHFAFFYHTVRHHGNEALAYAEELRDRGRAAGLQEVEDFASANAANALLQIGDWPKAQAIVDRFVHTEPEIKPTTSAINYVFFTYLWSLLVGSILAGSKGEVTKCFDYADRAIALCGGNLRDQTRFHVLYFAACRMACRCGDFSRGKIYLDMLERLAQDYAPWQFMILSYQGWVAFGEGRVQEAHRLLEKFCSVPASKTLLSGTIHLVLSDVRRLVGDLDGAERAASEVLAVRSNEQDPFMVGTSLRAQADVIVARNDPGEIYHAAGLYARAIENSRAHGAFTTEVPAALGLARLEISQGRSEVAREILADLVERVPDGHDLPLIRAVSDLLAELNAIRPSAATVA